MKLYFVIQNICIIFALNKNNMRIISFKYIREFSQTHADAELPLREWFAKTSKAEWKSFNDVKKMFNSADTIGNDHFVFNIKGNQYRLIATIRFDYGMVYIRFLGTHAQYTKIDNCSTL